MDQRVQANYGIESAVGEGDVHHVRLNELGTGDEGTRSLNLAG
jgi:predicted RNA-binding protein with TRAM domain